MKKLNIGLAALFAASLLTACGGGGSGDGAGTLASAPASGPGSTQPSAAAITVHTQSPDTPGAADCPRLTSDAQAAAALDLSNPSVKAINDLLQQVDPVHAFTVFSRRPHDFINWVVSNSANTGVVDFVNLGVATHETLHMDDVALAACAPVNQEKYQFFGQQLVTDLTPGSTSAYGIVAETIDQSLTSAQRYQIYIVGNGAASGDDFHVLLDEFAAYTGGAYLELQYLSKMGTSTSGEWDTNLGGTVNFMVFVENYLKAARLNHPATYAVIQNSPSVKAALQTIWTRAEQVLKDSYPYTTASSNPRLITDGSYFAAAYSGDLLSELDRLAITHAAAASWSGSYLP